MAMLEIFIELTNQIFWEGYAEQLAKDNPAAFQTELAEFMNLFNSSNDVRHDFLTGQSDHTNHA
jgi:hypothetical protein